MNKNSLKNILAENERRNKEKKKEYNPLAGVGCYGERFEILVPEKQPVIFLLPVEIKDLKPVKLLQKHGSIIGALKAEGIPHEQADIDFFWLKLCEEREKHDFEFYAAVRETIEDKQTAELIPFHLNPGQRRLLAVLEDQRKANVQILAQVLKARQMGFSTLVQMYMKWIQTVHRIGWNSVVCAHIRDAAINVRSMYERSMKYMPPIGGVQFTIKNFQNTQNIKEIPERSCRITVGFATEPESVRSQNVKMIHFSEVAFFPHTEQNNPELLEASLVSSAGKSPYTMIVRESTANGVGDFFYEQWQKAKAGKTAFIPVFAPWYIIPLYEEPFSKNKLDDIFKIDYCQHNGKKTKGLISDFIASFTEYEWNLWNNHPGCTLENINWRRQMAASMPSESKMRQEFPSDDIEAFQDSGQPVFAAEMVEAMRSDCRDPIAIGTMAGLAAPEIAVLEPQKRKDILRDVKFINDPAALERYLNADAASKLKAGENKVHVWEYPDKTKIKNRYHVSFDPQKGISDEADYGVIKVLDRYWMMYGEKPEVVALFYGHIDKDITIWIAAQIAKWYNDALLVIESNTYDSDTKEDETEFIFNVLSSHYDNLYYREQPAEKVVEGAPIRYGFQTNRNTKPAIISHYNALLREQAYIERDEETLNEARVYETKKDGTAGAKQGKRDDRLMATMIGLYVCYNMPLPVKYTAPVIQPSTFNRTAY